MTKLLTTLALSTAFLATPALAGDCKYKKSAEATPQTALYASADQSLIHTAGWKKDKYAATQDIVDIAAGDDTFSTLVAAVGAAGLVETLKSDGPFTVFAPTNEAFAALPAGTVENLLLPENKDDLVSILTYHVVSGKVMSGDLSNGLKAATVNGEKVKVDLTDGVRINNANVVKADIAATNGVIHVIDTVLLPGQGLNN